MEKELNIAAILKEKPKGTKLWSPMVGDCVFEDVANDNNIRFLEQSGSPFYTDGYGKYSPNGECLVFPSKQMQDWSKFAWKKGDVLKHKEAFVMFIGWSKDDYSEFKAKYTFLNDCSVNQIENYSTNEFCKASEEEMKTFINNIEEDYNGKLNLQTLEIEHPNPEFKEGDIVVHEESHRIYLLEKWDYIMNRIFYHARLDAHSPIGLEYSLASDYLKYPVIRPAIYPEKQQLFSALEKKNKRWNPDTKAIEDLPKKCELEPFQKVLVRDYDDDPWMPNFFSCYNKDKTNEYKYGCIAGNCDSVIYSKYCIPYNEETKHLLDTTDDWKGGEG